MERIIKQFIVLSTRNDHADVATLIKNIWDTALFMGMRMFSVWFQVFLHGMFRHISIYYP